MHRLVEEAPQLLPLAGSPEITVVGREVQLGSGYADLLAIESTGRLAVIEVKLSRNAEARRAIVAQTLSYAAYLHGMTVDELENRLSPHFLSRDFANLAAAASSTVQGRSFDDGDFYSALSENLSTGTFRLVFVLDQAPPELVRLTAYLEAIAGEIAIDLITVSAYDVNGAQVIVPQRAEPERQPLSAKLSTSVPAKREQGYVSSGFEVFEESVSHSQPEHQVLLKRMLEWAKRLDAMGVVKLSTYQRGRTTNLLPYLKDAGVGIVTVYNDASAYVTVYRRVLEKRAPQALARLEELIPVPIKQGSTIPAPISEDILEALTEAYIEASSPADSVIVAASHAYNDYAQFSAYICQENRSFRDGLLCRGFYANRQIQPEVPQILGRRDHVLIDAVEAENLRSSGEILGPEYAEVIETLIDRQPERAGQRRQIFLLTTADDPRTTRLDNPIPHDGPNAWVQSQRYVKLEALKGAASTAEIG